MTRELLPALLKSKDPRIVNLSSMYHSKYPRPEGIRFDKINDEKNMTIWERYGQSKLGNILLSRALNKRYGDKIWINSVHPGFVDTDLFRGPQESYGFGAGFFIKIGKFFGALNVRDGALTQLYCATSPDIVTKNIKNTYFVPIAKQKEPLDIAKSDELAEQLWSFCEKLVEERGL